MRELVEYARQHLGTINCASAGKLHALGVTTPQPVSTRWHDAIASVMAHAAVVERYNRQGIVIRPMTLDKLPPYLRSDKERWAAVAAKAGLKSE